MKTNFIFTNLVLFIGCVMLIACSPEDAHYRPSPNLTLLVNSNARFSGNVLVESSPLQLEAVVGKKGQGTIEFFDGVKSIGIVGPLSKSTTEASIFSFVLMLPVTVTDNGLHTYKAVFTGLDAEGNSYQASDDITGVTLQLK